MQNTTVNFMSHFLSLEFIDTFVPIEFVIIADTISIIDIMSLHVITEVLAIPFKSLLFS